MWRIACVVSILIAAADTAGAQSIFPAGGHVQRSPRLWITSAEMPRIEVTDERGPVVYEVDELQVESGPRRIVLRPDVSEGPFTVKLDGRAFRYEVDIHAEPDFGVVEIQRIGIERVQGRDTLVIDAEAEPWTVMYFLNHDSPRALVGDRFGRYVWAGPGRTISRQGSKPVGKHPTQRFELPLAALGVSCTRGGSVELMPYTTHMDNDTTVHSIVTLDITPGKVSFERLDAMVDTYQPCIGASYLPGVREALIEQLAATPVIGSGPSHTDFGPLFTGFDDVNIYAGLLGPDPEPAPAIHDLVTEPVDDTPRWLLPIALAGIVLLLWRATSRAAV